MLGDLGRLLDLLDRRGVRLPLRDRMGLGQLGGLPVDWRRGYDGQRR